MVRKAVTLLLANCDLACRKQTSGESVQKVGNFIEIIVRETWPSGWSGFDISMVAEKETERLNRWKSYFGI